MAHKPTKDECISALKEYQKTKAKLWDDYMNSLKKIRKDALEMIEKSSQKGEAQEMEGLMDELDKI